MMLEDFGIDAVPVPLNDDGIDLVAFEEELNKDNEIIGILCQGHTVI